MSRYEIKLVGRRIDLHRIRANLELLSSALRELHPERTVQSVYLDTPDGQALADNLAGIAARQKLRVRWYGEAVAGVVAQLECKRRHGVLGDKPLFEVAGRLDVEGVSRRDFLAALRERVPATARGLLSGQEPVQWIWYRREYFGSADGRLRVTLDRDLGAADLRFGAMVSRRRPTPLPELVVVEVKAAAGHEAEVQKWLQEVPLRPSRCSKFVLAHYPGQAMAPSAW